MMIVVYRVYDHQYCYYARERRKSNCEIFERITLPEKIEEKITLEDVRRKDFFSSCFSHFLKNEPKFPNSCCRDSSGHFSSLSWW